MNAKEMAERKRQLEADIAAALDKFTKETGLMVDSVYVRGAPFYGVDSTGYTYMSVEVTAKLP